jgi:hypothetical protein
MPGFPSPGQPGPEPLDTRDPEPRPSPTAGWLFLAALLVILVSPALVGAWPLDVRVRGLDLEDFPRVAGVF